ncbi:MAG: hypothetical protein EXR79_02190 [Myxococcales bacterium]|nr:hypothetical protein [Myxococcales bacterium]
MTQTRQLATIPAVITEHTRFQLEASKLGRDLIFQVTVFEKEERKRKKLFAETQCSDPFHLVIQFIIREAPDFDNLLQRFVNQLEHRGYAPTRMRLRLNERWQDWTPVPYGASPAPGEPSLPLSGADAGDAPEKTAGAGSDKGLKAKGKPAVPGPL